MMKTSGRGGWHIAAVGLAGLAGVVLTAAGAHAADPESDPRGGRDQAIVRQLHSQNQDAMAAARIAQERTTRDDVRRYAAQVLVERAASDTQLLGFAQAEGMNVPEIDTGAAALPHGPLATARLTTATPERFDGEFAAFMNAQAQADVDQATKAAQLAFRPGLQGLIRNNILPRLAGQESGATALASALPVLPPQVLQQPGGFPYPSWTTTGNDLPPPGVLR
jgi:predicted outer membrane protein